MDIIQPFYVSSKLGLVFHYVTATRVKEDCSFIFLCFTSGSALWIIYFFNSNFKGFNGLAVVYYKVNTHTHKNIFGQFLIHKMIVMWGKLQKVGEMVPHYDFA